MKELSSKYKERLNKKVNETFINTLGKEQKVEGGDTVIDIKDIKDSCKLEDSKLLAQSKEVKKVNKAIPSAQLLDDLLQSLQFNSRSNRDDLDNMIRELERIESQLERTFQSIEIGQNAEEQEQQNIYYNYLIQVEKELREVVCRRTRNCLYNVLAVLDKASRLKHSAEMDYKAFDVKIKSYIADFNLIRMQIDPFTPSQELPRENTVSVKK